MKHIALGVAITLALMTGAVAAVPASATGDAAVRTSATSSATATRWLRPTDSITPAHGCIRLTPGTAGIKVRLVQRRLGMGSRFETMDAATIARVKRFQARHGLRLTGVVGRRTWNRMGFREGF